MGYDRRVTLRCLCEDLTGDWEDAAQQRRFAELRASLQAGAKASETATILAMLPSTSMAAHPLVRSFRAAFETDDATVQRESISGLTNPHWWKQKVSRWRGAATDAEVVGLGEVWLCAGGIRAAGEGRDFYAGFTGDVNAHGPSRYLPEKEDRQLQELEAKIARRDAWNEQVRLAIMICLSEADDSGVPQTVHVPPPAPASTSERLMHVTVELERAGGGEDEELLELLITLSEQDHSRPSMVNSAFNAIRSTLEPVADEWRVLPGVGASEIWSVLISAETLNNARQCRQEGRLSPGLSASSLKLGIQAHYTPKDGIVAATLDGDAVRALCGRWFVPTANPDALPVCRTCRSAYDGIPAEDVQTNL